MDVLFFGAMNPRREALLAAVNASGLVVHVLTGDTMTFGGALDATLARTKIVLNLHFYDGIMVQLRVCPHCLEVMMLAEYCTEKRCHCARCMAWHVLAPSFPGRFPGKAQESPAPRQRIIYEAKRPKKYAKELLEVVRCERCRCGAVQEMSRIQHAISLRCLVVSQRSVEPELDAEWGGSIVIADDQDIPQQLRHFLEHPRS